MHAAESPDKAYESETLISYKSQPARNVVLLLPKLTLDVLVVHHLLLSINHTTY